METREPEKRSHLGVQSLRFLISGSAAGLADLTVYTVLTKLFGLHPLQANLISRPLGGLVSFTLNKFWTFENRGRAATRHQALRYLCIWIASFAGSEALVGVYFKFLPLTAVPAKLAAEGTVGILSFFSQKFWAFR